VGSSNGKRPARSPAVVGELILDAARSCFAESGYTGTTTRQIAARADVVENLIFKRFGSKEALFEAAVVGPFRCAVDAFLARWSEDLESPHSGDVVARAYVERLYDLLEGHAELLLAMMADRRPEHPLQSLMEELERVAVVEIPAQGWTGVDVEILPRLHFGMVAFNAAFRDALYGPGRPAPDRERIIDEMAAFLVHGTAHRPASGA
jgi:AcrR family transcriptional regulator